MGGSYYSFPCSILSTGKDWKTPQRYPDVPTTSRRISLRSMDSFQGLTPKNPSSWHRYLDQSPIFYDHVNPVTRRTIDQSAGGKLRDRNAEESWALLEDLALYDNEILEVLAHAPIYNAMLDKYMESLELGENGSAFVQEEVSAKMEDPGLFTLPCRLRDSKPFDTLVDLGSCVNIISLYLFKKLNIRLLEETGHIFGLVDGTKSYPIGIVKDIEVHIGKLKLLNDFYVIDMKKDFKTPLLVERGFLATTNAVIDCRKAKIEVGEGITRLIFRVKGFDLGEEEAPYWNMLGKRESYKP
ncbi:MAK10-like protein [Tanacetum coccineum]